MITFEKTECRQIIISGVRWGIAYYIEDCWWLFKACDFAGRVALLHVGRVSQLGPEVIADIEQKAREYAAAERRRKPPVPGSLDEYLQS